MIINEIESDDIKFNKGLKIEPIKTSTSPELFFYVSVRLFCEAAFFKSSTFTIFLKDSGGSYERN